MNYEDLEALRHINEEEALRFIAPLSTRVLVR